MYNDDDKTIYIPGTDIEIEIPDRKQIALTIPLKLSKFWVAFKIIQ